jgi:hypothetical protein
MKLALFSVLADVIVPLYVSSFLVECTNQTIAGAGNEKLARDRGRGEDSATRIKLPKKRSPGGCRRCIPRLSPEQRRKEQKNPKP